MKKFYSIIFGVATIGAVAFAGVSLPKGNILKADTRILEDSSQLNFSNSPSRLPAGVSASDIDLYWNESVSYYDSTSSFNYYGGEEREFGTRVEIEGDKATIYHLFDMYYGNVLEEYPVEGEYNYKTNTITINGTAYEESKPASSFISVAKVELPDQTGPLTLKLFAGEADFVGQFTTTDRLVFNVSEDLGTISTETAFAAYAFNSAGNPVGFYDFYKSSVMTRVSDNLALSSSVSNLTFPGRYVCQGLEVSQTIQLYNKSAVNASVIIKTDSNELSLSESTFELDACSSKSIVVSLTASKPGKFNTDIIVSAEGTEPLIIPVEVTVETEPDYARIVKSGIEYMTFQMMEPYPFIIEDKNGQTVAISTNEAKGNNTNSGFDCYIDIPNGKTGVFSWNAEMCETQPNSLIVSLDYNYVKYNFENSVESPVDMSGAVVVPSGNHTVNFNNRISMDWSIYGKPSYSYVWDLDLILIDSKPDNVYAPITTLDFGKTYFDLYPVEMTADVELLNTGSNPLFILGFEGKGNFGGIEPGYSIPAGQSMNVTLTWNASALGEDTGSVVIKTTGGDVNIDCKGLAEKLPVDYSEFVTQGNLSFNTSVEYPFVVSENGKYLYNSSSKQDSDGPSYSWIETTFEVPEDMVGRMSWEAINSSENIFEFMGYPSVISGTLISIDGSEDLMFGGENTDCSSSSIQDPTALIFREGVHSVRFTYKKTSNDDSYVFGDDRLKLFGIGLELLSSDEFMGLISTENVEFPQSIYCGCVGHYPAYIISYSSIWPEIISTECDGPFSVKETYEGDDTVFFNIEFTPTEPGNYENELIIHTEIGDFSVICSGKAVKSDLGTAIFYEGFEYNFEENWIFEDNNNDANTWQKLPEKQEWISGLAPYEGASGLILLAYDSTTFTTYEMDDYAMTPEISLPSDGVATLRFMIGSQTYDMKLEVLVGIDTNNISDFNVVKTFNWTGSEYWTPYTMDLSEYNGKTIRIAFHSTGTDVLNDFVALDDILVASTGSFASAVETLPSSEIKSRVYVSMDGIKSEMPHKGMNILITTYNDGKTEVSKRIFH